MKHVVALNEIIVRRSRDFVLSIPTLRLSAGDMLCITGANGSGKTTFIECLTGLVRPDSDSLTVCGHQLSDNLRATKAQIGYIPDDEHWLISGLCAAEYFELLYEVYAEVGATCDMRAAIKHMAATLQFNAFTVPLESLSHGNKKKVQILAGLMHQPSLIIVDELRNGLDPLAILAAESILKHQIARGACIVAATHDLWWAERIASRLMLLNQGSVVINSSLQTILGKYGSVEAMFRQKVGSP